MSYFIKIHMPVLMFKPMARKKQIPCVYLFYANCTQNTLNIKSVLEDLGQ